MKKILFITNLPASYKIDFFNELGKKVDLTVVFERTTAGNRNKQWYSEVKVNNRFKAICLSGINIGNENSLDLSIISCLRKESYDVVLINGYSSYSEIAAITYLKKHKKRYAIICDGIMPGKGSAVKEFIKRQLISPADFWLSPNEITDLALQKCGAVSEKIYRYPFSSIYSNEVVEAQYKRSYYKSMIGCDSKYMILFVGQMIHRKGIDVLAEAVRNLCLDYTLFLVGDKTDIGSTNSRIVNIGFLPRKELKKYYMAADISVLPSREDIWGLVINESLSFGTPVVATDKCGAALEMIENGQNGLVISADKPDLLRTAMEKMLKDSCSDKYMKSAIETAKAYTIENMAEAVYAAVQING